MVYLLVMERWNIGYKELMETPQWVVDHMMMVMDAEGRVEKEREQPKGRR